ncbi:MAG TPA: hypothetical protein VGX03_01395 [Candidatus Binatia bacterium]|nr:hypothetical protein [Candidatus Binatia bacterium]
MTTAGKSIRASIGAVMLLVSLSPSVYGRIHGGVILPFGGKFRNLTRIKGSVVCVGCSLEEAQKAQAEAGRVYELKRAEEQRVVLRVDWVDDAAYWESVILGHRLWVRAPDNLWRELTAEENLFKKLEISGLLHSDRTFDLVSIIVNG